MPPFRFLAASWVLGAAGLLVGATALAQPPPGAFELLARIQDEYRQLGASGTYRDRGELDIWTPGDRVSFHRHFETRIFRDGSFRLVLRPAPGESPTRVLWRDAEGSFHFDAARGEIRRATSLAAELQGLLPTGGIDALAVPSLLLEVDPWLDPDGVSLDREGDTYVLHLSRLGGALDTRVHVERADAEALRITRLETDFYGPETLKIRVVYRPEVAFGDEIETSPRVVYEPPAETPVVEAWSDPVPPDRAEEARATFGDVISVDLLTLVVRVTELGGTPIPGLGPDDFRVTVHGSDEGRRVDVPVTAVDWVSSELTGPTPDAAPRLRDDAGPLPTFEPEIPPPNRRVIFFVQADKNGERVGGHLRLRPQVVELAESFPPGDRLAVVGFDSHLKLWQDFTRDRGEIEHALGEAILFGGSPPPVRTSRSGPLGRALDLGQARRAATPEKALELVGRALQGLDGEKEMVFVGWGLGRYGRGGVRMTWEYEPALAALHDAEVTVHVLDVSRADYHDLEIGLRQVARETGGAYFATFRHPESALSSLSETLSAYYLLRVDRQALPRSGSLKVTLAPGVRGQVLVRPVSLETRDVSR